MRVLTDEVPTLFSVNLMEISARYKAKPKCWRYAIGEHGVISDSCSLGTTACTEEVCRKAGQKDTPK